MPYTNGTATNGTSSTNGTSTNGTSSTNGHISTPSPRRPLLPGIYAPTMTFFLPDTPQTLDIPTIKSHSIRLARAGLVGLVTMGSNGEAVHLSPTEKSLVTSSTREALSSSGYDHIPIIAGCSEGSISLTLSSIYSAQSAGAEYTLLLSPSYYRTKMDERSIEAYFLEIASKSPLPIIIYNYPGAVSGIDLDSDILIKLAKHPNIIGTKFTCGNTGKLTRVAAATGALTPFSPGSGYMAFGGMCDFTLQTLVSGGSGIIAGGANVMPKTCVKVWNLYVEGKQEEAFELQKVLSKGDWVLTKAAIAGTKQALQRYFGYGGVRWWRLGWLFVVGVMGIRVGFEEVMGVEKGL
jgi:L-threo-3-deoxy-hexylosonate aldolase